MVNKNTRFLQKALQALPKLSKNSLIKFCEELIQEHYTLYSVLEQSTVAIMISRDDTIIFENSYYLKYISEAPNIVLLKETGVHSIKDLKKKNRIFYLHTQIIDNITFTYIIEQTDLINEKITNKTQASLQALETLASGISHEIKNPLSAIDIHTQLLQYKIKSNKIKVQDEIAQYINIVKSESDRLLNVLDTFLNITRKTKLTMEFTELKQILENINLLLATELNKKGILLTFNINSVPKIFTSPPILQQIVLDLLRNSIEAFPEKSNNKQINITLKENNIKTHIILIVEDSGVGIDANLLYKIFDPYFTTKKEGNGLGLTLVKKMIDDLGGEIIVGNSLLGGAKFELYFPISRDKKLLS